MPFICERILAASQLFHSTNMSLKLINGVYHWRKMIEGHSFSKSTKTSDFKVATTLSTLWEAEALRDILVRGTAPINLHDVIGAFLREREGKGSYKNAKQQLGHFLKLPNIRMSELTLDQIQGVVNARRAEGKAHNTVMVLVIYWNALVQFAINRKWTAAPKLPKIAPESTRIRYLTADEERRLFAALDVKASYPGKTPKNDAYRQQNKDLVLALLHLGCRFSEAGSMTWSQVDLNTRKVLVYRRKGGIDGTMVMSDKLFEMFSRRRATSTSDYVFPNKTKNNNNHVWFRRALREAGISEDSGKISLHTCRHTAASRWLQNSISLVEVKQLLGHQDIASTMVYAHIETGAVADKAAAVMNGY